jgi:hypothetical protein
MNPAMTMPGRNGRYLPFQEWVGTAVFESPIDNKAEFFKIGGILAAADHRDIATSQECFAGRIQVVGVLQGPEAEGLAVGDEAIGHPGQDGIRIVRQIYEGVPSGWVPETRKSGQRLFRAEHGID